MAILTDWHAMETRLLQKLTKVTEQVNAKERERQAVLAELDRVQAAKRAATDGAVRR